MSYAVTLPERGLFEAWRSAARRAISHRIPPDQIDWHGSTGLFAAAPLPEDLGPHQAVVPPGFLKLANAVIWHKAPERLSALYQALWRLDQHQGEPLSQADPLGRRLNLMAKAVGRDIHKMHAFVRFREIPLPATPEGDDLLLTAIPAADQPQRRSFAAWFEPEHSTLEPGSSFFAKRFADMDWLIATPQLTAEFRQGRLRFLPGGPRPDLPEDASETLWATYFANIFNPARIKLDAMRSEMPKKYWKNLPETRLIPGMLKDAEARVARMHEAAATVPRPGAAAISTRYRSAMPQPVEMPQSLAEAQAAASQCQRCRLCEPATQTVWGQGAPDAALMLVGEQPGDHEDLAGQPFVGPAGQLLRRLMEQVPLAQDRVWLTNAVKHFKFQPRGKQRLHQNPDRGEIQHCRWWLGLELAFVQPKLTLALGASAAYALTDDASPLGPRRGKIETGLHGGPVLISWHPSLILRLPSDAAREAARSELAEDLRHAASISGALLN